MASFSKAAREPSETAIQGGVIRRLQAHGFLVVRFNGGGFRDGAGHFIKNYIVMGLNAYAGFPDVAGFKDGRVLLLEVKKPKGKLSPAQERFRDYAAHFGVVVHVVRHPEDVTKIVESEGL